MTRPQQQLVVFGLLIVGVVAVYGKNLRTGSRSHERRPVDPPASSASAQEPSTPTVSPDPHLDVAGSPWSPGASRTPARTAQRERAKLLAWGRDPFVRGSSTGGSASGLVLSGILWDAKQPMAIVNGLMVHVGDELEGYRVESITNDHVTVTDGAETFQLDITP